MIPFPKRTPLAGSALLTLLFAIWGGLLRLQWHLPVPQANWISFHGPLMVSGFFGTVIGLARANILKSKAGLVVPLAAALGAWTLLLGGPEKWGAFLFLMASLGYLAICAGFFRIQPAFYAALALVGGAGWAWGNFLWFSGKPIPDVIIGWQTLFILTIASERLEAIHWKASGVKTIGIMVGAVLLMTGALLQPFRPSDGVRVASAGEFVLALALLAFDAAREIEKAEGWRVYSRVCLVSGYGWLLVSALVGLVDVPVDSGFAYDAFLHSVFLGLVFSMVFSHAPLLLPRILKTAVPFHRFFYSHWFLLQASLVARVGGDALGSTPWRRLGALLNAIALLLFLFNTALAIFRGRRLVHRSVTNT